jgi:diguanylate cyclase (GGDEF)-like protein
MGEDQRSASDYIEQLNALGKAGLLDDLDALRAENREFETLINDAASLVALPSIDDMIGFVTSRFLDRFIPQRLLFLIEDPAGGGPRQYLFRNLKPDPTPVPGDFYEPLRDWFRDHPNPISLENLRARLGDVDFGPFFADFAPRMLIPMLGIGGVHGLALLGQRVLADEYSGPELMYVFRLMRFLSIGIQNSLHHASSITDAKTGLYNHRYFQKRLDDELARIERHETQAGLIMIDVDHFKNFNDTWGHLAGDEILIAIARAVKSSVRAVDVAARFGGEEFCVLAIECEESRLVEFAERIRAAIEALRVPFDSNVLQVTASLGCCHIDGALGLTGQAYMDKADKALYRSKSGGRNRSTVYRFGLLDRASAKRRIPAPQPDSRQETELVPLG